MQYFFIFGNVASIAALIGFIMQLGGTDTGVIFRYVTLGTAIVTVLFWIYFYLSPANTISTTIKSRLNYSGRYRDSNERQVDVYEGQFEARDFSTIEVAIPPFEDAPVVTVFRKDGKSNRHPATVAEITSDVVRFSVTSSDGFGIYGFRARGKTLSPIKPDA
jgi:hypothetical protein